MVCRPGGRGHSAHLRWKDSVILNQGLRGWPADSSLARILAMWKIPALSYGTFEIAHSRTGRGE